MQEHSLERLDFYRMRARIADYCFSHEGRAHVLATLPLVEREALEVLKRDLDQLMQLLEGQDIPHTMFPDIEAIAAKASKEGMVLDIEELFAIGLWARSYEVLRAFLTRRLLSVSPSGTTGRSDADAALDDALLLPSSPDDARWALPGISRLILQTPSVAGVRDAVFEVLTEDGSLRDLPRLRSLQALLSHAQAESRRILDRMLSDPELRDALQSTAPTERDGRMVLAVKANFKGRVRGIAHEFSATGQTVFIEPLPLIDQNNRIMELQNRLQEEIRAILREASQAVHGLSGTIQKARRFLGAIDARLARALQALREGLTNAALLDEGIRLYQARHPMLGKKAVPIDVDLPQGTRVLIITGPNTGGKTVSLKTMGLFALLHQFGAGIAAASTSGLAVFDNIFADIGDEQSIDQSLSTFSGHMKVISEIVAHSTDRSLILLDELGAGTDPEEGCAIAMALLDHFLAAGSLTVVTTHHGILKNYGYTRQGCLNASMEFDAEHLAPTYRMRMGIPGESRALEIAAATGLPSSLVQAARTYLSDERTDYAALIRSLGEKQRELDRLEQERRKLLKGAVEAKRAVDLKELRLRQRELELRRQGVSELNRLLAESRSTIENLVRQLREAGETPDTGALRGVLRSLAREAEAQASALAESEAEIARLREASGMAAGGSISDAGELRPGDRVKIAASGKEATVLQVLDARNVKLAVGSLRMTISIDKLRLLPGKQSQQRPSVTVELASSPAPGRCAAEIDLRGMRLQEALQVLERHIDAASLAGLSTFAIIHGTGEGVLSRGIHEWLRHHPSVADYYFARPEDGGFGKTWVHLK